MYAHMLQGSNFWEVCVHSGTQISTRVLKKYNFVAFSESVLCVLTITGLVLFITLSKQFNSGHSHFEF
jgi:hypothetical protein